MTQAVKGTWLFWCGIALLATAGSCPAIRAQESASTSTASTAGMLQAFEPSAGQEYELGDGDEISVDVNGRPELSGKHVLGPDGRITVPVAGDLELTGKSRGQAARAIEAALGKYYQNITVSVSVDRYTSNHVMVFGAVEHPGLLTFDDAPSLLEVIARSGLPPRGGTQNGNGMTASIDAFAPASVPEQCVIYRQGAAVLTVQLRKLLKDGDPMANMRLKRNDTVFVPGDSPYVSVLGNVSHPGLVRLQSTSTLAELLAQAGGLTEKSGRYPKILVVHPAAGAQAMQVVSFRDIVDGKPSGVPLRSGDLVYVPESGLNRAADSLQKISPLLTLITLGALLN